VLEKGLSMTRKGKGGGRQGAKQNVEKTGVEKGMGRKYRGMGRLEE